MSPARVNPIQLCNVIQVGKQSRMRDGLLYVQVVVNDIEMLVMTDSGANNNFVTDREATHLELALQESTHTIKIDNVEQQRVRGSAMVNLKMRA